MILKNNNSPLVIITRPSTTAGNLIRLCKNNELDFVHLPVIRLEPVVNLPNINLLLQKASILLFVSPTAIEVSAANIDFDKLKAKLLVLGKPSAKILAKYTSNKIYYPNIIGDSERILDLSIWHCKRKYLVIIKGDKGRDLLRKKLQLSGWQINEIIVYNQKNVLIKEELLNKLNLRNRKSIIITTSTAIVDLLFNNIPKTYFDYFKNSYYISIHNRISDKLRKYGVKSIITTRLDDKLILKVIKNIGDIL